MKWDEQSRRLRRKASDDEHAMCVLAADASAADAVVGFHAQQAVEKQLKALLCARRVVYRRTHDLTELLELLIAHGIAVPSDVDAARRLGPYAVEMRYEDVLGNPVPLDRGWAADCVCRVRQWVDTCLSGPAASPAAGAP